MSKRPPQSGGAHGDGRVVGPGGPARPSLQSDLGILRVVAGGRYCFIPSPLSTRE